MPEACSGLLPSDEFPKKNALPMKQYRQLFFDLDNTLWDFDRNSRLALAETFRKFNPGLHQFDRFFEVYSKYNEDLWELYRKERITKQELTRSRFDLSFRDTGITGIDGEEFNREYLALLPHQTHLCEGARSVLEKLSAKHNLYIITNGFSEVQYKKLENSGLSPFFKRVFTSEEIRINKPSPEIFRYAMKTCNARKKESLMVGDSWEVDIVGAMETGMDQVWVVRNRQERQKSSAENKQPPVSGTKTYVINQLEELLDIIPA
jgi:putative hydrolase of the HAD superfamily